MCIDRRGGCSATWSGCWVSGLSVTLYVPVGPLADVCVCVRARAYACLCVCPCVSWARSCVSKQIVAEISVKKIFEIAKIKQQDLPHIALEQMCSQVGRSLDINIIFDDSVLFS